MYEDDPNWRMFFGILNNLYPTHPLHIDIAGTVESIDKITAQDLYTCYRTFYQPSNMVLFVVGKMEPEKLMKLIGKTKKQKISLQSKKLYVISLKTQKKSSNKVHWKQPLHEINLYLVLKD